MKPFRANPLRCAAVALLLASRLGSVALSAPAESVAPVTNQVPITQLRSAAQVNGEGVFLAQLLERGLEVPALRLGDAPPFGKSAVLKRGEIEELARASGFDKSFTNWTGPEAVRISRRVRQLAEPEIIRLLSSILQKQFVKEQGELELRLSQPWATASVPDEPVVLKILDLPTTGVAPVFIVRFEFETAHGEHIGPWQAALQAKVWREIWVAGSVLKRGLLLRGADLSRERRDMLLCRQALADFSPDDPSLELVEPVQAGSPIFARFVRPRAIVRRGQSLVAMVHDGALMITLKVEALEDGAAGQIIRVRNPLSRRDLHGKVLDEENVLVSL